MPGDPASAAPSADDAVYGDAVYGARATAATTPMRCPDGRYCFRELEPDGTAVYAFAAG